MGEEKVLEPALLTREQQTMDLEIPQSRLNASSVIESLPVFSAARAIPDLATSILSAYCNGIRVDFHPPA